MSEKLEKSEKRIIDRTEIPLSRESLAERLGDCGLKAGSTVIVHLAMSPLGWVIGGAEAVILALIDALGTAGTLMMVAHSGNNSDPSNWGHPPVPESWWQMIRDHAPAFNPQTTPTRGVGAVPELFRRWPGTLRSNHPSFSFTARGPNADYLLSEHPLEEDCGDRSPLGKLYELDAEVLLLGVTHWNNTSLHLAEFRASYPGKSVEQSGCAILVDGQRRWVEYQGFSTSSDDFGPLGEAFDAAHQVQVHKINAAEVRLFKQRAAVDFGVKWMEENRRE
ncbi:MAG: AAC(3) family N-acetyltransferase [Chloroflexota bacterium]